MEPYVRRRWPQVLIVWSRLIDGRWRDPSVGRDLLVGLASGLALSCVYELRNILAEWRDGLPAMAFPETFDWAGARFAAANVLMAIPDSVGLALGLVLLLVLMRLLFRSERAAMAAVALLITVITGLVPGRDFVMDLVPLLLLVATMLAVVTRLGLLAFAALLFAYLRPFMSFSWPDFLTASILLTIAAVLAPAVFGFYTATRGRAATAWLDE